MSKIVPLTGRYRPQAGLKVRTLSSLGNPDFKLGKPDITRNAGMVKNRRENCDGIITNAVEGFGVDAWYVQHSHGIAPYMIYELSAIPVTFSQVIKNIFG